MSGDTRESRELEARLKAQNQRVYISGLQGHHSLETGVAYYYRGHFIYSYPAGTPIEPISFSIRTGIMIAGITQERSPIYNPQATNLVPEQHVAALHRSYIHEWNAQQQQKEDQKKETAKALEEEAHQAEKSADRANTGFIAGPTPDVQEPLFSHPLLRSGLSTTLPLPSQPVSCVGSNISLASSAPSHKSTASLSIGPQIGAGQAIPTRPVTAYAPQTLSSGPSYTPHDRAQYLAYSAPGSRHASVTNTPHTSRPVSPTNIFGLRNTLRSSASTSHLNRLLANEGLRRALTSLPDVAEGKASRAATAVLEEYMEANPSAEYIDPDDIAAFIRTVSRPPSQPLSRSHSSSSLNSDDATSNPLYLCGLGQTRTTRPSSMMQAPIATSTREDTIAPLQIPGLGHVDVPREHRIVAPIGTGRPRTASIALNEAYNAAHPPNRPMMATSDSERVEQFVTATPDGYESPESASCSTGGPEEGVSARTARCPIHYGPCDGVTTTNRYLTQQMRETRGFRDLYPTIRGKGDEERVMIDWQSIMDQEKAKMPI